MRHESKALGQYLSTWVWQTVWMMSEWSRPPEN